MLLVRKECMVCQRRMNECELVVCKDCKECWSFEYSPGDTGLLNIHSGPPRQGSSTKVDDFLPELHHEVAPPYGRETCGSEKACSTSFLDNDFPAQRLHLSMKPSGGRLFSVPWLQVCGKYFLISKSENCEEKAFVENDPKYVIHFDNPNEIVQDETPRIGKGNARCQAKATKR